MGGAFEEIAHSATTRTRLWPWTTRPGRFSITVEIETTSDDFSEGFSVTGHHPWAPPHEDLEWSAHHLRSGLPSLFAFTAEEKNVALATWELALAADFTVMMDLHLLKVAMLGSAPTGFRDLYEAFEDPALRGILLASGAGLLVEPSLPTMILIFAGYTVHVRVLDPVLKTLGEMAQERLRKGRHS